LLLHYGTNAQRRHYLPRLAVGDAGSGRRRRAQQRERVAHDVGRFHHALEVTARGLRGLPSRRASRAGPDRDHVDAAVAQLVPEAFGEDEIECLGRGVERDLRGAGLGRDGRHDDDPAVASVAHGPAVLVGECDRRVTVDGNRGEQAVEVTVEERTDRRPRRVRDQQSDLPTRDGVADCGEQVRGGSGEVDHGVHHVDGRVYLVEFSRDGGEAGRVPVEDDEVEPDGRELTAVLGADTARSAGDERARAVARGEGRRIERRQRGSGLRHGGHGTPDPRDAGRGRARRPTEPEHASRRR